jgi:hypothetical protein
VCVCVLFVQMNPSLYDSESVSILREADRSTHEFIAMLEEADDDSINLVRA